MYRLRASIAAVFRLTEETQSDKGCMGSPRLQLRQAARRDDKSSITYPPKMEAGRMNGISEKTTTRKPLLFSKSD